MKKCILFLYFTLIVVMMNAAPIHSRVAQNIAQNFWTANGGTPDVEWVDLTSQTPFSEFYIFANANGNGFVIVSGDDCVIPILGYSLNNAFDPKMPAQIADYLNGMNQEIAFHKTQNLPTSNELSAVWTSLINGTYTPQSVTEVTPLLTTTWDQSPYYNDLCPGTGSDKTVTGCVATATAQIMKFWNWPTRGTGSHSYTDDEYGIQSANFGNTTYQWTLMPNALSYNSSASQINAVATLMYHVGVAVEMDYGTSAEGGSGAYSHDYGYSLMPCPKYALTNYFNYKNTIHSIYKDQVSDLAWTNALKDELDAGRPVLHSGNDTAGGHAFVCDGYDNNNLFHFNWGWGGYCDGYYAANDLSPQSGGTGGNATYTFNMGRGIVVGIEPNRTLHANLQDLYYPQQGGTQSFILTFLLSNDHWSISSSQSWLTVSPNTGAGSGGCMVNINATASANNTGAVRTAVITITQGTETWTINVTQNECSNSDMCDITLVMEDSYGDGWNGASVTVSSASGYQYGTYTFTLGTYTSEIINICPSDVVFTWNAGNFDSECSFSVQSASGDLLLSIPSINSSVTSWTLTSPCDGPQPINCEITTFPWTESFEGDLSCWGVIDADGDGNGWFTAQGVPNTGTYSIASYSYHNGDAFHSNNYLITPEITLPTSGNYRLTFYAKSANVSYPDSLLVKLTLNGNPTANDFITTLMPKTVINTDTYQQYSFNLNSYLGLTIRIAFIHQSYDGYWVSLDDITIEPYINEYTVTVNSSNNAMGVGGGGGSFSAGDITSITATANSGYRFTGWNDGNTENPREITVTGNATYTANFSNLGDDVLQYDNGTYEMSMGAGGDLYWAVRFPASELANYSHLAAVRIMDAGAGSYELKVYQGGTTAPGTLMATQTFNLPGNSGWYQCTLSTPVELNPSQSLWLVFHNNTIQHPAAATNYAGNSDGSWVSLDGSSWTSLCNYDYYLTWMVRAVLSQGALVQDYTITVNSANPAMGSATGGGTYPEGTQITISATPATHYHFSRWSDGNTQNPRTITVAGNATYTAYFDPDQYSINVTSNDPDMGYTVGSGTYSYASYITITAVPNDGYEFIRWNDNVTDDQRVIEVTGPATYIAYFQAANGIDDMNQDEVIVFCSGNEIHVKNAEGYVVGIYDMAGRLIATEAANSKADKAFTMNAKGVYLVKIGNNTVKKVIISR